MNVEFERPISVGQARALLQSAPGIVVIDKPEDGGYATPLDAATSDPVYVSRLRKDDTVGHALSLWVVADNVRKGAALTAVQIAEELLRRDAFCHDARAA